MVAQFERDLIVDRTRAGLAAAKARGRTGGRPPAMTPEKVAAARALLTEGHTVGAAAAAVGVGRSTLYRHLDAPVVEKGRRHRDDPPPGRDRGPGAQRCSSGRSQNDNSFRSGSGAKLAF